MHFCSDMNGFRGILVLCDMLKNEIRLRRPAVRTLGIAARWVLLRVESQHAEPRYTLACLMTTPND